MRADGVTKGDNGEDRTLKQYPPLVGRRKKLVKKTEWTIKEVGRKHLGLYSKVTQKKRKISEDAGGQQHQTLQQVKGES